MRIRFLKFGGPYWPIFVFVSGFIIIYCRLYRSGWAISTIRQHPVELLHARAELRFKNLLERQSSTPEQAGVEYRRRYGRAPPPGFDKWVEYALARGSPIIDDFDILEEGIAPFYRMGPHHIKDLMRRAAETGSDGLGLCMFEDGGFAANDNCHDDWTNDMMVALGDAALRLPNVTILLNFQDEPTILPSSLDDDSTISFNSFDHQSIRPLVQAACDRIGPRSARNEAGTVQTYGLPFVQDIHQEKDICAHPEYAGMHGLFVAPDTFRQMPVRIPLLSAGAPHPSPISSFRRLSIHGSRIDMPPRRTRGGRRKECRVLGRQYDRKPRNSRRVIMAFVSPAEARGPGNEQGAARVHIPQGVVWLLQAIQVCIARRFVIPHPANRCNTV